MPHMTHTCRCGKMIHWPWDAKAGDVWVCRKCKCRVTLVSEGGDGEKPVNRGSRPSASSSNPNYYRGAGNPIGASARPSTPRPNAPKTSGSYSSASAPSSGSASSGSGCMLAVMLAATMTMAVGVVLATNLS